MRHFLKYRPISDCKERRMDEIWEAGDGERKELTAETREFGEIFFWIVGMRDATELPQEARKEGMENGVLVI